VFWMMNTIRKVMMVVLVLIINCQVSEKPSKGPLNPHTTRRPSATTNTQGLPSADDTAVVKRVNISGFFEEIIILILRYT